MELGRDQWMLNLVGKRWMRNRIFTEFEKYLPQILVNYKGKTSSLYSGEASLATGSELAPPCHERKHTPPGCWQLPKNASPKCSHEGMQTHPNRGTAQEIMV